MKTRAPTGSRPSASGRGKGAIQCSQVPEVGTGSARRLRGRTGSLAVGTLLSVILISSLSIAETSPRDKLQGFFGQVAAILKAAGNSKQARDDVRNLARGLFDGR